MAAAPPSPSASSSEFDDIDIEPSVRDADADEEERRQNSIVAEADGERARQRQEQEEREEEERVAKQAEKDKKLGNGSAAAKPAPPPAEKKPAARSPISVRAGQKAAPPPQFPAPVKPPQLLNWAEFMVKPEDLKPILLNWLMTLWFAPTEVANRVTMGDPRPIWLPYWIFDCHTTTSYSGQVCIVHEDVVGGIVVQREAWSPVKGVHKSHYKDIVLCGAARTEDLSWTSSFKDSDMTKVYYEPDPRAPPEPQGNVLNNLLPTMLGGRPARRPAPAVRPESYQLQRIEPWQIVWRDHEKDNVRGVEHKAVVTRILAEKQGKSAFPVKIIPSYDIRKKLVFIPYYYFPYCCDGRAYRVVIHGQTGSIAGERPYGVGNVGAGAKAVWHWVGSKVSTMSMPSMPSMTSLAIKGATFARK